MRARSLQLEPPLIQTNRFAVRAHRYLAKHSNARAVCLLRRGVEAATALLHSEDHDPQTNGEFGLIRRLAPNISVAVDVGANHGDWALAVSRFCPGARVLCFELASPTREALRRRVAETQGIEVAECGLGDAPGQTAVKFYQTDDRWTSRVDYPHRATAQWLTERVERGDVSLASRGVDYVDLMKVDAEGSDFSVLVGCSELLEKGAVGVVQFEYGYACVLAGVLLLDFYELLSGYGYRLGRLGPRAVAATPYRLEMENFFGPNFVAVHRSRDDLMARLCDSKTSA